MPRRALQTTFQVFSLDPDGAEPLHRQLYDELRRAIAGGRLAAGSRLPASRELAAASRVSRNTVLGAYEQLLAEGYIESRPGSGTFVAESLADVVRPEPAEALRPPVAAASPREISARGRIVRDTLLIRHPRPVRSSLFRPGLPALDRLPLEPFRRILDRLLRNATPAIFAYGDAQGHLPLREAIAAHLTAARGAHCTAANIVIVNGSQQGITLCARLLADPGDTVWLEEPGYFGARASLQSVAARIVPVPVDREGLDVAAGIARAPNARLAYVTPSHQNPLGVTMTLARRMALVQWAQGAGAWIVEDDNASDYRYRGRPLAALQGIDTEARVIYIGTFSKVFFSSLRLGYLVLPEDLVPAFTRAHAIHERGSGVLLQAALAEFMQEGHFARHLRRMRTLYASRLAAFEKGVARHAADVLSLQPIEGGMSRMAWLPPGVDDVEVATALERQGINVNPLSEYRLGPATRGGLVMGFTGVDEHELERGIERVATTVREILRRRPPASGPR